MPASAPLVRGFGVASVAALLLAGCTGSGEDSYADLDREAADGDALPAAVLAEATYLDASSSRYVGEDDGVALWLARGADPDVHLCLVAVPEDEDWVVGCGYEVFGQSVGTFAVRPDGAEPPEGFTAVSENVYRLEG
ncbi:hypothetical protein [Demequina maris]|uniref:hypothetical protein n=1 Tax=Demequina maris TaxID=1638982 RepID=UPI000780F87F|nr:hypothetical protein [Demequina maris]